VGGIVVEFGQDLRVVLEYDHFEVEDGEENFERTVEHVSHDLQFAPNVFSNEVANVELCLLAVALCYFTGDAMLLLQTDQYDVLFLHLHLRNEFAQTLKVEHCLLLVFELGCA
jgi:hypothetical protein